MKLDLELEQFRKFLTDNGYSHLSAPMNTRHSDMYLAYRAGRQISLETQTTKQVRKVVYEETDC